MDYLKWKMIDFKQGFVKLAPITKEDLSEALISMFLEDEEVLEAFRGMRDFIVFTNKRVIAANVQGLTGKKVDYTSLPYKSVQAYSIETSGSSDRDSEMELYISLIGKVRFEIKGQFDIVSFNKLISQYIL